MGAFSGTRDAIGPGTKAQKLNNFGYSFFQDLQMLTHAIGVSELFQPSRWFIQVFEGQFEGAIMHRNEPLGLKIMKCLYRFVRPHVNRAKRVGKISSNRQKSYFRRKSLPDFLEAVEIGAVPGVINLPSLMLKNKTAISAMVIPKRSRTPVLARSERNRPVCMRKTFPPL